MSLTTDPDEPEPSVTLDSLPDNIRESIRAEAPEITDRDRIPLSQLRDLEPIIPTFTVVNFRIVGVYLGSVPGDPPNKNATGDIQVVLFVNNPTVKDVVDAVKLQANAGNIPGVSGFRYNAKTMSSGRQVLDRVEVDYTQSPKPSRGYAPGTYVLQQQINQDPQRVFQYYIYDVEPRSGQADAVRRKNTDNSFIGFNRQPSNSINDGDYVVWRLLTIRTELESPVGKHEDSFQGAEQTPEARLPDGIIRTNSRLAQMAARGSAQPTASEASDQDDGESPDTDDGDDE